MSKQKATQSLPILADVQLKGLPFYDLLGTLMQPTTLLKTSENGISSNAFSFNLSPMHASEIQKGRYLVNNNIENSVQVQLRLCACETSTEQNDCYPADVHVTVNNKDIQLPPPLPTRPGHPTKRPSLPLNITDQVKVSPTVSNSKTFFVIKFFNQRISFYSLSFIKFINSNQILFFF